MKGDERNWWSEETLEAFERKTKCLKNQYSNFTFDGGTVWQHIFLSSFPPYF